MSTSTTISSAILFRTTAEEMVFDYAESWLNKPGATPLSQSLPLRKKRFKRKECRGYFAGILPEEAKREIIARNLGISARNDYAMLERIGGECAGAVTFIPAGQALPERNYGYRKLSAEELAAILKELPKRPLLAGEEGIRLSLAGAQDKVAVRMEHGEVCLPLGGAPSTHILKPAVERFEGVVFNEALCMKLAAEAGLPAASVETMNVDGIDYLLVERYDRIHKQGPARSPCSNGFIRKISARRRAWSPNTNIKRRRTIPQAMFRAAARGIERAGHRPGAPARRGDLQLPRRQQRRARQEFLAALSRRRHGHPGDQARAALRCRQHLVLSRAQPGHGHENRRRIFVGEGDREKLRAVGRRGGLGKPLVRARVPEMAERVIAALGKVEIAHPVAEKVAALIRQRSEKVRDSFRPAWEVGRRL
jgi:HipA-like protein